MLEMVLAMDPVVIASFMGAIFLTTGFVIHAAFGVVAGMLGGGLRRTSGILNKLTATVFGGLAVRLVMD